MGNKHTNANGDSPFVMKSNSGQPFHHRTEQLDDYYTVDSSRKLGRGHYATVWLGERKKKANNVEATSSPRSQLRLCQQVAIKKIKKSMTDDSRLRSEIMVLKNIGYHANIVQLLDVFETSKEVQLVMELCTGGELFERLAEKGPYSEAICVKHIYAMASAIQFLHQKGIVHRDLKPENILLSSKDDDIAVVKVADFGLAKLVHGTNMKTKCGTWGYSAPEMINGSGYSFGYDSKVDSWSLGTIIYILLCGFHPFDPNGISSDNDMMRSIKSCSYDFTDEAWNGISDGSKDLIRNLLVLDPEARFDMNDVLEHPWIKNSDGMGVPVTPLSPTIHKELGRFRDNSREKTFSESFSMDLDEDD